MGSFVGSAHRHGRKMKLMRSGRHATPSQVEKVAEKAGKAAPAMAVTAGALMAVPHGHAAAPVKHSRGGRGDRHREDRARHLRRLRR